MIKDSGLESTKMEPILNNNINYFAYDDLQQQSEALAEKIIIILSQAIINKGSASIAVSGGSTPKVLFNILSNSALDWEKVTVSLVDDRWLAPNHPDSNQHLVEQQLLQNKAINASFVGLYQANKGLADTIDFLNKQQQESPFDVLLLGMGNDGHTASLFPCSTQLKHGLTTHDTYLMTQPKSAAYERISLSANAIQKAQHLFLQLKGNDKQQTLNKALTSTDEIQMPVRRFLDNNITVLWCP